MGITKEYCVCIGSTERVVATTGPLQGVSLKAVMTPDIAVDTEENCIQRYRGEMLGVNSQKLLDAAHYLSAGMVSFARGLNDTPKIVALLLTLSAAGLKLSWAMFAVAVAMAAGGLFNARKVAETMSRRITPLNHGQGFTANLVTAFLVTLASRWGLPVSTTHASCGSLFGIGLITQKGDLSVMRNIVLSWVLTLPVAAALSAISYWGLTR
jgi:PiT family inorganic phosphate transporter